MSATRSVLMLTGRVANDMVSFIVFTVLDLLDLILCFVYKFIDLLIEAEWKKPCYYSSTKEAITSSGKILLSEQGESEIVCLRSSKLQWEDISDTLYTRPSIVKELKRLKIEAATTVRRTHERTRNGTVRSTFTINSTIGRQRLHPIPRWSDCDCMTCTSWSTSTSSGKETQLFVRAQVPMDKSKIGGEDVLFIHGFISSSAFWTETLFPNFSSEARSKYRLFAMDLLGFGRSPKPTDSLYTLREHVEMIQKSVLEPYKVKSFHIVAHSLGCILAVALAVNHPGAVKSLTLLAPPYFPVPKGEVASQYVLRKVAPRRVWPPIALGASITCWYEHISRTACLLICKNHRFWEFLTKLVTQNRTRTYMLEIFFCHTHNAAWHTLHNIICGTAGKVDDYLDAVRDRLNCEVAVFHGRDDELLPVDCSYQVQARIPRARVKVIEKKDHITIVLGRQKAFAKELEEIWKKSTPVNTKDQTQVGIGRCRFDRYDSNF